MVVQYLKKRGSVWYDSSDANLRLQWKGYGLNLRQIHFFIISQKSLQPLRLAAHTNTHTVFYSGSKTHILKVTHKCNTQKLHML